MVASQTAIDGAPVRVNHGARTEILIAVMLTLFLSALDQTIVGTALPRVVTDLSGNQFYVWVVTVYLLSATVSRPIYGKLSDLFGRRPMIMIASASSSSARCSPASPRRCGSSSSSGGPGPRRRRDLPDLAGDHRRPLQPTRARQVPGPVRRDVRGRLDHRPGAGRLPHRHVSWRWVFFVNLPLGLFALFVCGGCCRPCTIPRLCRSIDYSGAAVFPPPSCRSSLASRTTVRDWTDPLVSGLILLGVVLGAVLVWIESRAREPIVPLELFRNRTVTGRSSRRC